MNKDELKYEYIIFSTNNEYFEYIYSDLNKFKDIHFINKPSLNNSLEKILFKVHHSGKINSKFRLPFKKIWNKKYEPKSSGNKPFCFIYFIDKFRIIDGRLQNYLKAKYPNSKHVLYFQDLLSKSLGEDFNKIESDFDLILSYDPLEAEKYNFLYYPLVFSKIPIPDNQKLPQSDLYFLGKAKDRLDLLIQIYENFTKAGYRCDFNIVGVPEADQKYPEKIHYISGMSYGQNLEHVNKTKCLLEVLQTGAQSPTLRSNEAITYNKGLITNNKNIKREKYYSQEQIKVFEGLDDIANFNIDSLQGSSENEKWIEELDPINLIYFIENHM